MINLEKEIREQPSVLASLKDANYTVLTELVKELKEKKIDNVYLVARGTSDHACIYAQYLFGIIKFNVSTILSKYGWCAKCTRNSHNNTKKILSVNTSVIGCSSSN